MCRLLRVVRIDLLGPFLRIRGQIIKVNLRGHHRGVAEVLLQFADAHHPVAQRLDRIEAAQVVETKLL